MNAFKPPFAKCYLIEITLRIMIMADQAAQTSEIQKLPLRRTEI